MGGEISFCIIIPVFNVNAYIRKCFESIINQTYRNFSVVIVDDGSSDGSEKICDEYCALDSRFRVVHKNNQGLVAARRDGIKIASGDYYLFCDSDDYVETCLLEELYNAINTYNNPDVIIYGAKSIENGVVKSWSNKVFEDGFVDKQEVYNKLLLQYVINPMWLKAFSSSVFEIEKSIDYSDYYDCPYGEDLLQSINPIKNAKSICYIGKELYVYRTGIGMTKKATDAFFKSYKRVNEFAEERLSSEHIKDLQEKTCVNLLVNAYGAVIRGLNISEDTDFRDAYYTVLKSKYSRMLRLRERVVLYSEYNKLFYIIYILKLIKQSICRLRDKNYWSRV